MAKAIEIDGVLYRERRGKLVKIPDEWVGKVPSANQIRQRHSKTRAKQIYTKILRAQDADALRHEEDPHPENTKRPGRWHRASGRIDKNRNKHKEH